MYNIIIMAKIYLAYLKGGELLRYRVREIRKARGLTQEELAVLSGVSRPTIWAMETDDNKFVSTKTLFKIAKALEVEVDDLFLPHDGK